MNKPDKATFDRVWQIITEIGIQERHFNELQTQYRNMASKWLLATFAAIGFVISKVILINITMELLVACIALAGFIGIILIWILDLLVYHRLLEACFIEGLVLERQYSWLPPIRHNMMDTMRGEGVLFRLIGFYIGSTTLLILIAGIAASSALTPNYSQFAILALVLTIIIAFLIARLIQKKTENTILIEKRLTKHQSG